MRPFAAATPSARKEGTLDEHEHHDQVMADLGDQLAEILETSDQGVYVYLDDVHKLCNARFASLLGYASSAEWAAVRQPFPMVFVAPESRDALISAYQDAMERRVGSVSDVTWLTRTGGRVETSVILVPIALHGEPVALHFVEPR